MTAQKKNESSRRTFLKGVGALAAGVYTLQLPVAAGPFLPEDPARQGIPSDKKLNRQWLHSLRERGIPAAYLKSRNELRFIGMPVGGIMAGTLYLGGDGRLWLWDIFNRNQNGIDPKTIIWGPSGREISASSGSAYLEPPPSYARQAIEQGVAVKVSCEGRDYIRQLREEDWEEIRFTGQYPLATIEFTSGDLPFSVTMEAFSPFIPLNEEDSALPATVLAISVHNHSKKKMAVSVAGWLQNACLMQGGDKINFHRQNSRIRKKDLVAIVCQTQRDEPAAGASTAAPADEGTMCICLPGGEGTGYTDFDTRNLKNFDFKDTGETIAKNKNEILTGGIIRSFQLEPGKKKETDLVIAWHFPHTKLPVKDAEAGNYYAKKFADAFAVSQYVSQHFDRLSHDTKLWRDTWYDSTLPHWFLERTFANTSTLATTTSHRFGTGRFWGWEGVGCCPGTCTHVWQYAQAVARIFPGLERDTRERVDLGLAFNHQTGQIGYRGEGTGEAIDGQAGTILRILREHQMSKDSSFLQRNWPHIKKAVEFTLNHDTNEDGIIDGPQPNTLDAAWFGAISWISSLCLAAWRAGEEMALEMGDTAFAGKCHARFEKGKKNIEEKLFNGEYFIQVPGKDGKKHLGSYDTCEIDQVFGQSYAFQVGLGRILDQEKVLSALRSLWKYNFMADVGPYIAHHTGGRPYALSGDGGMVMDTNPRHDPEPYGQNITWQAGYFNECMSGFEHQVASHMMAEGMTGESLALTKSIHDRYHASRRNPFNEIECSDHYARAMASYGTFITACGFSCHGPKGKMTFAPRISPERFKAPFTAPQGWGSYAQQRSDHAFSAQLKVAHGRLTLRELSVELHENQTPVSLTIFLNGEPVKGSISLEDSLCRITFAHDVLMHEKDLMKVQIS